MEDVLLQGWLYGCRGFAGAATRAADPESVRRAKYKADLLELNKLGEAATKIKVVNVAEQWVPHVYHLMAQQLIQTLDELIAMLKSMFEAFSKGDLSWATFLKALGVAIGDVKKIQ